MKPILTSLLLALMATAAVAQDYPRSELFGGYSYLRTDSDEVDLAQFGVNATARRHNANLNGWNLAVTGNPTSWLGIVADFGGVYGRTNYSVTGLGAARINSHFHSFLAGPQFYVRGKHATGFIRAMVGVVKENDSATIVGQRFEADETALAAGFGGGVDVRLADRISLRLFQADLILTRFDGQGVANDTQKALRVSTGFVFRN